MIQLGEIVKENAVEYHAMLFCLGQTLIRDPKEYFKDAIVRIEDRIARERAIDPSTTEFIKILGEAHQGSTPEEYFEWLEGVLAYQRKYLEVLG